jgi:hypothetical protein
MVFYILGTVTGAFGLVVLSKLFWNELSKPSAARAHESRPYRSMNMRPYEPVALDRPCERCLASSCYERGMSSQCIVHDGICRGRRGCSLD